MAPAAQRAAAWLAGFPAGELRFDAAVTLSQVLATLDGADLRRAFERARAVADHDADNPHRRFWVPDLPVPEREASGWPPFDGTRRPNTDDVVTEALLCREYGLRFSTLRYVCDDMSDGGGYRSTHALWAMALLRANGCIDRALLHACARGLQRDVVHAQPATLVPAVSLDLDLFAERLLAVALTRFAPRRRAAWAATLLAQQQPDGSWGVSWADEPAYHRYHTTAVSLWALASWCRAEPADDGPKVR